MLGYHVHEKAVLMVSVPLGVLVAAGRMPGGRAAAGDFLFLSTLGTYSLFPLLFEPQEYAIKVRWWAAVEWCGVVVEEGAMCSLPPAWGLRVLKAVSHEVPPTHPPTHPLPLTQVLLLVAFNLIAAKWLPRLDYGSPATKQGRKRGGSSSSNGDSDGRGGALLSRPERLYLWGLVGVELATSWVLPPLLGERLPFLPLMAVSLYCSLGMLHAWRRLAAQCW